MSTLIAKDFAIVFLLFFCLLGCFGILMLVRVIKVEKYCKYLNHLIYLNNTIQISKGNGLVYSYKLIPSFNKLVYLFFIPWNILIGICFKKPVGFNFFLDFSEEDMSLLESAKDGNTFAITETIALAIVCVLNYENKTSFEYNMCGQEKTL